MKYTLTILILFLSSCSQKPQAYAKDHGDTFEVSYLGKIAESPSIIDNKVTLLSAYAAQKKGCSSFALSQTTAGQALSVDAGQGILGAKMRFTKLYNCVDDNTQGAYKVEDVIKVQESRYGSLRHLIKN